VEFEEADWVGNGAEDPHFDMLAHLIPDPGPNLSDSLLTHQLPGSH